MIYCTLPQGSHIEFHNLFFLKYLIRNHHRSPSVFISFINPKFLIISSMNMKMICWKHLNEWLNFTSPTFFFLLHQAWALNAKHVKCFYCTSSLVIYTVYLLQQIISLAKKRSKISLVNEKYLAYLLHTAFSFIHFHFYICSQWRWLCGWELNFFFVIFHSIILIIFFHKIFPQSIFLLRCEQTSNGWCDILLFFHSYSLQLLCFSFSRRKIKKFACEKLLAQFHLFSLFCTFFLATIEVLTQNIIYIYSLFCVLCSRHLRIVLISIGFTLPIRNTKLIPSNEQAKFVFFWLPFFVHNVADTK